MRSYITADTMCGVDEVPDPNIGQRRSGHHGMENKMQAAMSHVMPAEQLAKQHSKMAEPGTAKY